MILIPELKKFINIVEICISKSFNFSNNQFLFNQLKYLFKSNVNTFITIRDIKMKAKERNFFSNQFFDWFNFRSLEISYGNNLLAKSNARQTTQPFCSTNFSNNCLLMIWLTCDSIPSLVINCVNLSLIWWQIFKIESTVGLCFQHFIVSMTNNNTSRSQSLINDSGLQFGSYFHFFFFLDILRNIF